MTTGWAHATAARARQSRARRQARIEELEFLLDNGVPAAQAAVRAGWPSATAAARALYRARHPLARVLEKHREDGR